MISVGQARSLVSITDDMARDLLQAIFIESSTTTLDTVATCFNLGASFCSVATEKKLKPGLKRTR